MKLLLQFTALSLAICTLSACANYGQISENDVYLQKPTAINLDEDQNDITSYNAFVERNKGLFKDDYRDPRANHVMMRNQLLIMESYMPYGMFGYNPTNFHGMGFRFYEPFGIYTGHGMGLRARYGFGSSPFYDYGFTYGYGGMYNPYGYGHGHYFGHGFMPGYGIYNGAPSYNNPNSSTANNYYGKRSNVTSSSSRSSYYPKAKSASNNSGYSSKSKNNQYVGASRRALGQNVLSNDLSKTNIRKYKGTNDMKNVKRRHTAASAHRSQAHRRYTPSSSARRSAIIENKQPNVRPSGVQSQQYNRGSAKISGHSPANNGNTRTRMTSPSRSKSYSGSSSSGSRSSGSSSSTSRRR
ncbi:hypothetical protein CW751_07665 [Brumimicrobium salinarum]|uniref:Vitellogenin II n=1 Tax=Brumimicrobium salinarum TaxID=2058658 RepID=A0A2I0R376_9FLAO|nr:hypothetical protein [Brumimicrobium salinarum]PKR81031.1 hypothetical protein CW751_07665 [Brumimicrobium salinarum]